MRKLIDILRALRKSVNQRGVAGTIGRCLAEPLYRFRDETFDRRFHVHTKGTVAIADLDISEENRRHAERYQPVRLHAFKDVMQLLDIRHEDYIFVDFGSGKGRAMLLASEFPFQRIVGIEISPGLCELAIRNLQTYRSRSQRCRKLEVIRQNAATYLLPLEPAVFYFYNPFGADVMHAIMANLRESLVRHPRHVLVALYNPVLEHIVRQADFLRLYRTNGRCSIYESASPLRPAATA